MRPSQPGGFPFFWVEKTLISLQGASEFAKGIAGIQKQIIMKL
jgi:hypothetical protein